MKMERKDFIKKFAFGGSILLTAPLLLNSCSSDDDDDNNNNDDGGSNPNAITVDLTQSAYSDLGSIGGFAHKGEIIIIRSAESTYIALSNVCTHNGCKVAYDHSATQLICPCHASKFTTNGSVVSGPATAALKTYSVSLSGTTLSIT
jgi:cytochrome b6-f complex iron-sulfur subunit